MAQVKLEEEQEPWEHNSVVTVVEVKEELEVREIQSLEEASPLKKEDFEVIKAEALQQFQHVSVKNEEGEPHSSLLFQTVTEEDSDTTSEKPSESQQHSEKSDDTDDSEEWTPSAERSTPPRGAQKGHVSEGTKGKGHECPFCGKEFKFISKLKIHELTHTGEKPFMCTICEIGFAQKVTLQKHIKRIHTGETEKHIQCSCCAKSFLEMHDLKRHMRIHTGERPFKCTICPKEFPHKNDLIKHIRVHTGEKPLKCTICDKNFRRTSALKEHLRIHTGEKPFTCFVCGKAFTNKSQLTRHMRTHTGEKPYKCTICATEFRCTGNLKQHMRVHTKK